MKINDFDVDGDIKLKILDVRGAGKSSKVWRVIAEAWIETGDGKKFEEQYTQGLRKEEYDLQDKEKLRERLQVEYKQILSRRNDFEKYYHDRYVEDEEQAVEDITGEVL